MRWLENLLDPYCGLCETEPVYDTSLCLSCLDLYGQALADPPLFVPPRKDEKRRYAVWSCVRYEDQWRALLLKAKRDPTPYRSALFASLLARKLETLLDSSETPALLDYIWVPGKETKAGEKPHLVEQITANRNLSKKLSAFGISPASASLRRQKTYQAQHLLRKEERAAAQGRFERVGCSEAERPLLLFDDVVTTGYTLQECAKLLRPSPLYLALTIAHVP